MAAPLGEAVEEPPSEYIHKFIHADYWRGNLLHRDYLVTYDPKTQLSYFRALNPGTGALVVDEAALVVWIAADCLAGESCRGSWSMYFGPGSQYNNSGHINTEPHRGRWPKAIEAFSPVRAIIRTLATSGSAIRQVRIASTSKPLLRVLAGISKEPETWPGSAQAAMDALLDLKSTYGLTVCVWTLFESTQIAHARGLATAALALWHETH